MHMPLPLVRFSLHVFACATGVFHEEFSTFLHARITLVLSPSHVIKPEFLFQKNLGYEGMLCFLENNIVIVSLR